MKKRIFSGFLAVLMLVSMMGTTAFATNSPDRVQEPISDSQPKMTIRFISPEEMDCVIADINSGITPLNWFDDVVLASGKRIVKPNGNEYFRLTLVNTGFILDRVDVDGKVVLYENNRVVANKVIYEPKIIYGISRVIDIFPLTNHFTRGTYTLRVSDGDAGTTYTGTFD